MRERGILFSGPMSAASRDGSKTETRRVIVHERISDADRCLFVNDGRAKMSRPVDPVANVHFAWDVRCPYAVDRLWVRETWAVDALWDAHPGRDVPANQRTWYRIADDQPIDGPHGQRRGRWRVGRFMPRWASRTLLDVVSVHVERLQAITEAGARAEGPGSWRENPWVWVIQFRRVRP